MCAWVEENAKRRSSLPDRKHTSLGMTEKGDSERQHGAWNEHEEHTALGRSAKDE